VTVGEPVPGEQERREDEGVCLLHPLRVGGVSALATVAQSGPELIGSLVLSGIGGAMMLPTSLSLLNAGFRGRERG